MRSPVVVKLGGSAITDKSMVCTPRLELIHNVVEEISSFKDELILLHGGGSYAHPFATKDRVENGFRAKFQLRFVSEIELNLDQLTRIIGVALLQRGRPYVSIQPMSFLTLHRGAPSKILFEPLKMALRARLIPLIHGDLAFDNAGGCRIISADRIASLLGEKLGVSRVLFGCDVDGVYRSDPRVRREIAPILEVTKENHLPVLNSLRESGLDATGGMRGKVIEAIRLAKNGTESVIFNLSPSSNLRALLRGSSTIGTRFIPWN